MMMMIEYNKDNNKTCHTYDDDYDDDDFDDDHDDD